MLAFMRLCVSSLCFFSLSANSLPDKIIIICPVWLTRSHNTLDNN